MEIEWNSATKSFRCIATKNSKIGELIDLERTSLYVIDDEHLDRNCSYCLSAPSSLKACTGCQIARYCDGNCQKKDWKQVHKLECVHYRFFPNRPKTSLRFFLRVLFRISLDPFLYSFDNIKERGEGSSGIARLNAPYQFYDEEKISNLSQLAVGVSEILNDEYLLDGKKSLFKILSAIDCNSMAIQDSSLETVGRSLFTEKLAFINHSCVPNSCIAFKGSLGEVRAMKDIRINEEITIAYIDVCRSKKARQTILRDDYFFKCKCILCELEKDPLHSIEKEFRSLQELIDQKCFSRASFLAERLADELALVFGSAFPEVSFLLLKAFRCDIVNQVQVSEKSFSLGLKAYNSISLIYKHTALSMDLCRELSIMQQEKEDPQNIN